MDLTKHADKIPQPPEIGLGKYRHYKGKLYEVLGVGTHSESLEFFVIYKPLYEKPGSAFWIRPYEMFVESVEVDGISMPRFQRVEE